MIRFDEEKQKKNIAELNAKAEEDLVKRMAEKHGLPYIELGPVPVNQEALRVISRKEAEAANIAPFNKVDKKIQVGVLAPANPKTIAALNTIKEKGLEPVLFLASSTSLKKVWDRYDELSLSFETTGGALDISSEEIQKFLEKTHSLAEIKQAIEEVLHMEKRYRVSRILEIIVSGALSLAASDIHIEPEEESVRLRYRLDGVLTDVVRLDNETFQLLLSRVKLLSGLKLNIKGSSQDGRFTIRLTEKDIEIRTSVLPGAYNESVVLRVLDPNAISMPLEELGINDKLFKIIEHEIKKPNGMVLNTGPTGSGKTTSLYAFMKKINSPDNKILTIENPIEYHLDGIVQTQTNKKQGYTFLSGLRAALRQDPDVIMIGEIRDSETAEIAINAALTGHLVFSTLHTNNAAGTFPRLIDLGINTKVITSAINLALAQRLLRRIDPIYKKEVPLKGKEKDTVMRILSSIHDTSLLEGLQTEVMWVPDVPKEEATGYKGRIGIYEGILTDDRIGDVLQRNPGENDIWEAAKGQGILTMAQDGIVKILQGTTTLDELRRVIDLEE